MMMRTDVSMKGGRDRILRRAAVCRRYMHETAE